jgi:plasmid stabilization system protein ParE
VINVRFHPEALLDLKNAAKYYAGKQLELGQRFYRHVDALLTDIAADPDLFRVYRPPAVRRHFRRSFPYAVVYVLKPEHISVLAVMHFKQPPNYWLHRLTN